LAHPQIIHGFEQEREARVACYRRDQITQPLGEIRYDFAAHLSRCFVANRRPARTKEWEWAVKNFVQLGEVVTPGGVSSGEPIVVGNLFGVCAYYATETEEVEFALTDVFELPKASGQITERARACWSTADGNIKNATGAGLFPIVSVKAAVTSDATVLVWLDGVAVVAAGA
jgi:predicted RecA/RadA family phage recombinase